MTTADRLAAVSDPARMRMCRLLERHELSVGEVARVFQMAQSSASRHLRVLRDAGWIRGRAAGTATFYRLVADDLAGGIRRVWVAMRDELGADAGDAVLLAEDDRRVGAVLAERRNDSMSFFGRIAGEWDDVRGRLFGDHFTSSGLLSLVPAEWEVADIGCGTGNVAELLAPVVKRVYAVDRSEPMLDAARRRLDGMSNVSFLEADADEIPLESGSVDAAVCVLVLHHLSSPEGAVREMGRVVRRGGVGLIVDMYPHGEVDFRDEMGHVHLGFEEGELAGMMSAAGFGSVDVRPLRAAAALRGPSLFVARGAKA